MQIHKIRELLQKYQKDVWVMYNKEGNDKFFNQYIDTKFQTASIAILSPDKSYLVISILDQDNITKKLSEEFTIYTYQGEHELEAIIEEMIAKLKFPKEISLSYSSISDLNTDILTHGSYVEITKLLKKPYKKYAKKVRFSSAEKILYELGSRKTKKQIKRLKYLATLTNELLGKTFDVIKIGMSEKEIVSLTRQLTDDCLMKIIKEKTEDIIGYDMAWTDCPIVLLGENLAKGGHSLPSDKRLKKGDTIYFDFGIRVLFEDQEVLYTDMQRMGYALKINELEPPKQVKKVFQTLVNAIEDGTELLKPGVKGYKIDKLVRDQIIKAGYPEYHHATGHSVGLEVHDMGAVISKKGNKKANIELVENGVYTLEPRINIANGGSIEEMIQVTKFGGVFLCEPQTKLYLVK